MLTTNIIKELKNIVTGKNILLDKEDLFVYSQDATNTDKKSKLPEAVIFPETISQVQEIVKLANKYEIPITARGAGTNLAGACLPLNGGIVLSFCRMNKILEINSTNMTARVQPGVIVGDLIAEAEQNGLFYPPDPSNLKVSTIGGSIALNSGGAKSFKYGTTKDYIIDLKVVLADGSIINTGSNTAKNSTGYQLTSLFAGSEGTLGIVVEALLKLIPKPESSCVILTYYNKIEDAVKSVNAIINNKIFPATLDLMDKKTLETIEKFCPTGLLTNYEAALLIETDGYECSLNYIQEKVFDVCKKSGAQEIVTAPNTEDTEKIWIARRSAFGACATLKPNVETGDIVVPREKIPQLVDEIHRICDENNIMVCILGHIGDGNIHPHIPIDLNNPQEVKNYKIAKDKIHKLAVDLGGTLSGEHGIGCEKSQYIKFAIDDVTLDCMKQIKKLFDPKNILNPGKIF